ncbi:SDR family oxidoreductase [Clostridium sp. KNHs216]|uniref:SDR family oxidoreductase n=1 Tax=Clostridium sp. KNHs216 TaxID=1550235 RepID=UPI00114F7BC4|nr:SDR family oxidoreductase [Clostridium sp. KNHs216]TQI68323.1 2-deoxy-D-gluconate 3-dehydrogenase [Clostridium sp. KNHs216]
MFEDIKGKLAVVTGANRGIGKAVALGFAKAGANIVIIDLEVNEKTVQEIKDCGVECHPYPYNLMNIDGISDLIEKITVECGDIDVLYNNAGTQKRHPCTEFPKSDWDFVMDVNANSVFFLCQAVGRQMLKKGYGKIINTASLLSFQGGFTVPAYAASKGAVMQFSKSLSNEWAKDGININCVAPGYLATDLNTALIADPVRSRQILERIPAGRWGQPEDIVGVALFLASSASDYINGIVIPVDGGWLGR